MESKFNKGRGVENKKKEREDSQQKLEAFLSDTVWKASGGKCVHVPQQGVENVRGKTLA